MTLQLAEKHDIFKKYLQNMNYQINEVFNKTINDDPQSYFTDEVMEKLEEGSQR